MRRNSGIVGEKIATSTSDASGIHDLFDNYNGEIDDKWPIVRKVITLTNSNSNNFPEGSTSTFSITTEGYSDGDVVYWTITNVSGTALAAGDFDLGLSGSITINSNAGSVTIKPIGDGLTENNVVKFEIRTGSISGPVVIELSSLNVTDAAVPVGTDITTNWYEISNRFIDSGAYMGNSSDYNGSYDVGEVQTDFTGSGRIYIGIKVTGPTTYYNDISIAGIQVLDPTKNSLITHYIFNTSSGYSGSNWTTARTQESGSSTQGIVGTPTSWSSKTYYGISTSTGRDRFSWASGTGSSYTGTADGISSMYTGTIASVGDAQIAQAGGTYYAYRETSGSTRWSTAVMRSPTLSFGSGGYWIRVIHALAGRGGSYAMDPTDSLYISVV